MVIRDHDLLHLSRLQQVLAKVAPRYLSRSRIRRSVVTVLQHQIRQGQKDTGRRRGTGKTTTTTTIVAFASSSASSIVIVLGSKWTKATTRRPIFPCIIVASFLFRRFWITTSFWFVTVFLCFFILSFVFFLAILWKKVIKACNDKYES
jgi:hypothetical protein